ncbi:uncharacterized protein BKA78DRAFT_357620 [Phyllosticta capitalensis]|uniref:uncharacterized protein n=1 Tax=Phyllosticta capitalensis TaxID=121624 RepID=UPI0031319C4B
MSLQRSITNEERPRNVVITECDVDEAAGHVSSFGKSDADEEQKFGRRMAKRRRLTSMGGTWPFGDAPVLTTPGESATQLEVNQQDRTPQAASPLPAPSSRPASPPAIQAMSSPSSPITAGHSKTAHDDDSALASAIAPTQDGRSHYSPAPSKLGDDNNTYISDPPSPPPPPPPPPPPTLPDPTLQAQPQLPLQLQHEGPKSEAGLWRKSALSRRV